MTVTDRYSFTEQSGLCNNRVAGKVHLPPTRCHPGLTELVKEVKTIVLKCVIMKGGILRYQGLETLKLYCSTVLKNVSFLPLHIANCLFLCQLLQASSHLARRFQCADVVLFSCHALLLVLHLWNANGIVLKEKSLWAIRFTCNRTAPYSSLTYSVNIKGITTVQ